MDDELQTLIRDAHVAARAVDAAQFAIDTQRAAALGAEAQAHVARGDWGAAWTAARAAAVLEARHVRYAVSWVADPEFACAPVWGPLASAVRQVIQAHGNEP